MEHDGRCQIGERPGHRLTVEEIDVAAPPSEDVRARAGQEIDEVAAGEPAGACDEHWSQDVVRDPYCAW